MRGLGTGIGLSPAPTAGNGGDVPVSGSVNFQLATNSGLVAAFAGF